MPAEYRADQVGSFLRPPEVLEAHRARAEGRLDLEALRKIEDEAILKAIQMQIEAGIDVLSDGEYRRSGWSSDFVEAVEGYVPGQPAITLEWHGGAPPSSGGPETPPANAGRIIGQRLRQIRRITAHESGFLKAHAGGRRYKVTMPAASYLVTRGYVPGVTDRAYGSRREVLAEVAAIVNTEIKALIEEGVPYIQLDNPHYPDYVDPDRQARWKELGVDPAQALREDIEADNASLTGLDRSQVTLAMHLCRGNGQRGQWHTQGGYDPIAEQVFGGIDVDRFLLEYDSERAGGFEPLRFLPANKSAVLGLVTTKAGDLEQEDALRRRIDEAARIVPLERLALSPQCGFASVMTGNPLTWDQQRRKLELVVATARAVWG
jgi:5-methyltetrahydropteroyltriglutamate--homocysteine methyltransferase